MGNKFIINYNFDDVPTIRKFIECPKKYKLLIGPLGSGKSSGCVMHLFICMIDQKPGPDGVRRTRYAIVRNTRAQLNDTTKKTIDFWLPKALYEWKESKFTYIFKFRLDDGTFVYSEWILKPLDDEEQVRDLLSLDLTGAWLNEAREIREDVFKMLRGRIGRYPPKSIGGPTYPFIIMDTNPPHTEHWLYKLFEELRERDKEWAKLCAVFKQPSGLSPHAENIRNLPPNYYQDLMLGQDEDWIRVYVHGEYGYVRSGKPVFALYRDSIHCAKEEIKPIGGLPIYIGMDFGLTPACVFVQLNKNGQLLVFDEIVTEDATDIETFVVEHLLPKINTEYYGFPVYVIGDPAGRVRSQTDSRTCFQILRSYGIEAWPAHTNSLQDRIRAVNLYLSRYIDDKEPAFLLSPKCVVLRKAMNGEYCFRRMRTAREKYTELPEKNLYSHVADALQYVCLGLQALSRRRQLDSDDIILVREERKYRYGAFI